MSELSAFFAASILGLVEGLTEFLPVSSTGHLILAGWLLGFEGPLATVFEIVIQLGAILAVVVLYFSRLWRIVLALPSDPNARRFATAIILAFLPAAILGVLLHGFIKNVLFSPWVVVISLFVGGVAIILIERRRPQVMIRDATAVPPLTALEIGICQTLALIPGVSRSGATILGAVMLGVERRAAAEFSFFLAIPTMLGATVLDLYKNRDLLSGDGLGLIAVGFVVAFVSALVVVRALIAYLARHDFRAFGWYRIAVALIMAVVLLAAR